MEFIYKAMRDQILQAKEMRLKLYYWKIIVIGLLFSFSIQVGKGGIISILIAILIPIVALLFDFHIMARNAAIKRDGEYIEKHFEPLIRNLHGAAIPSGVMLPEEFYRSISSFERSWNRRLETYGQIAFTVLTVIASAVLIYCIIQGYIK